MRVAKNSPPKLLERSGQSFVGKAAPMKAAAKIGGVSFVIFGGGPMKFLAILPRKFGQECAGKLTADRIFKLDEV